MPDPLIPYPLGALLSIAVFIGVHLLTARMQPTGSLWRGKFLSMGGGIAIAYVFIDLLPKLCKGDIIVQQAFSGIFPFVERHVYVMALCGFLLFFAVDRLKGTSWQQTSFALSMASYAIFNFLVGYAVTYKNDPDIQPLALFTLAIALHYFTNDYTLNKEHGEAYKSYGRWVLASSLLAGWVVGNLFIISSAAIALINAFVGGGVIMNVIRHELPTDNPNSTATFLIGAIFYTAILFAVGA